jgi:hypothetical protein
MVPKLKLASERHKHDTLIAAVDDGPPLPQPSEPQFWPYPILNNTHSDHDVIGLGLHELGQSAGRSVSARLGAKGCPERTGESDLEHVSSVRVV